MKGTSLPRRLGAGAAGLAVGLAAVGVLSAPVQATIGQERLVEVEATSTCGALDVTVENVDDSPVSVLIVTDAGHAESADLAPGEHKTTGFAPGLSYEVFANDVLVDQGAWEDPGDCDPSRIPVEGTSDCDSLTVMVTNLRTFNQTIAIHVEGGGAGEQSESLDPGGSDEFVFDAAEGTVATVMLGEDVLLATIAWEEPEGCDEPATDEATETDEGGTDELAATGSPTLWIAGIAVALLIAGGGLFFLTRRRGVDFTA